MTPEFMKRPELPQSQVLRTCASSAQKFGHLVNYTDPKIADCLLLWGIGHPDMMAVAREVLCRGKHFVCWDLGYFRRKETHPKRVGYRFSVDAMHPDHFLMKRDRDPSRWESLGIKLRNEYDPDGPIILVGMGWKSARMYGEEVGQWEKETAAKIKEKWPDRRIIFRPKPGNSQHCQSVAGTYNCESGSIEDVLKGASLVVCRHSNVGIDAIVAGVPAVTIGGAAVSVLSSSLDDDHYPIPDDIRFKFLSNLAWMEWSLAEIKSPFLWEVIGEIIEDVGHVS